MGKRRRAREAAIQVLFHLDFSPDDPHKVFDLIGENFNLSDSITSFTKELVLGVCQKKRDLDMLIGKASKNWRLDRMARLDRCILRLAAFEILYMEDIPPKVSIDEAVEMGKKFGSHDSGSFINGVLDNIYTSFILRSASKGENKKNEG